MSSTEPSKNGDSSFSIQRVAIAIGTLIIVALTIVAALFLAMQDIPVEEPTAVVQISPTPLAATATPIASPSPTKTSTPTHTPSITPTPLPPVEPTFTAAPPTAAHTNTPLPSLPTVTSTPVVVVVITPTSLPVPPVTDTPVAAAGVCQPPPSWVTYVVQTGDTLNSLASRTNTSVYELQQFNCLDSFTIQPGQTIHLPLTPPTPTVTYTPSPTRRPGPTPTRSPTPISPQIDSVVPNRVDAPAAEEVVIITVLGKNFKSREQGFRIELRGPQSILLQLGEARSDTSFDALVPSGLPQGTYALVVTNPNDRAGIRQSAFTIGPAAATETPSPAPDIVRFTPTSGSITDEIELTVQGVNFRPNASGFKIELQDTGSSFKVELDLGTIRTDTNFEAIIRANTLQASTYNLVVTNPDGRSDIASDTYRAFE